MQEIVECVMNISEGQDAGKLAAISDRVESEDAILLGRSADADHHRAVLSFIGTPDSVARAAFAATKKAVQLIDLRAHRGVHPRAGAVDVIPFVPVKDVSMDVCRTIAHAVGKKIADELAVPVYLYGEAATHPERKELSEIRKGQFEELAGQTRLKPDFGPPTLHPTAGATAVGARRALIAYNVYLATPDIAVAREIASRVREKGGGLEGIKALGFYIAREGLAQVSMNVTNYRKTTLLKVFQTTCKEASRFQTEVAFSEIVGLVPKEAICSFDLKSLKLKDFRPAQVLEDRIEEVLKRRRQRGRPASP